MTGDELQMLLYIALVFFGTLSIYPIYYVLDTLKRRRRKKEEAEQA